jgi:hypothetical protein
MKSRKEINYSKQQICLEFRKMEINGRVVDLLICNIISLRYIKNVAQIESQIGQLRLKIAIVELEENFHISHVSKYLFVLNENKVGLKRCGVIVF